MSWNRDQWAQANEPPDNAKLNLGIVRDVLTLNGLIALIVAADFGGFSPANSDYWTRADLEQYNGVDISTLDADAVLSATPKALCILGGDLEPGMYTNQPSGLDFAGHPSPQAIVVDAFTNFVSP